MEDDARGEGWRRERRLLAEVGQGQWRPFTPLLSQGLSVSSVWMGALSLGHDTMRGSGSAAVSAFHVSI